jgi:sugar lactone lactonase YvrE
MRFQILRICQFVRSWSPRFQSLQLILMNHVEVALKIQANLGECPRWDEQAQLLYWIDINSFKLHRFDPATGRDDFLLFDEEIGCFSLRQQAGFLLAMRSGFYLLDGWNTERRFIADPESTLDKNRFNDGRADAKGRMFAGSIYPPKDYGGASIYSLEAPAKIQRWVEGLLTSNGIAFSPDNKTFYYADTPSHAIQQCDYDLETGVPSNCRLFHQFPHGNGRPDGAAVDSEGCYWTALYEGGRIVRLNPVGDIVQEIAVPAKCPTMVAFGGPDLKTLFITTVGNRPDAELQQFPDSGSVFKVRVDVPGLVEHRYLG